MRIVEGTDCRHTHSETQVWSITEAGHDDQPVQLKSLSKVAGETAWTEKQN